MQRRRDRKTAPYKKSEQPTLQQQLQDLDITEQDVQVLCCDEHLLQFEPPERSLSNEELLTWQRHVASDRYYMAPHDSDAAWISGFVSSKLAACLLPVDVGCPARVRFDQLISSHPAGVPLTTLFPEASTATTIMPRAFFPRCSLEEFGAGVGIKSTQNLGEMLRGAGQCCGWIGALWVLPERPLQEHHHTVYNALNQDTQLVQLRWGISSVNPRR